MPYTPEQIAKLKELGFTDLAADAEKLNAGEYVPKARFNEVNQKAIDAQKKLDDASTANQTAEQERLRKQGEFQTLAEQNAKKAEDAQKLAEQIKKDLEPDAVAYRALQKAKVAELKEKMGDLFLPEYEGFSLASLEKLTQNNAIPPVPLANRVGGRVEIGKAFKDMTPEEKRQAIADVKVDKSIKL